MLLSDLPKMSDTQIREAIKEASEFIKAAVEEIQTREQ